jgi:hypothetical protein
MQPVVSYEQLENLYNRKSNPVVPNLHRIDLQQKYPCPCCRGQISQIVLTEAFGCDQCQKIFVLQEDGYAIEQASTLRPLHWRWDGKRWRLVNMVALSSWSIVAAILLSLLFIASSWYFLIPERNKPTSPNQHQDR